MARVCAETRVQAREGITCNRSRALRVGAAKLTRLSPKFMTSLIRVSGKKQSGHLICSFPQCNWQQEASCFGRYKYFALAALLLPRHPLHSPSVKSVPIILPNRTLPLLAWPSRQRTFGQSSLLHRHLLSWRSPYFFKFA